MIKVPIICGYDKTSGVLRFFAGGDSWSPDVTKVSFSYVRSTQAMVESLSNRARVAPYYPVRDVHVRWLLMQVEEPTYLFPER